jgi:hypothetical protein
MYILLLLHHMLMYTVQGEVLSVQEAVQLLIESLQQLQNVTIDVSRRAAAINVITYAQALRLALTGTHDEINILYGLRHLALDSIADSRIHGSTHLPDAVAAAAVPAQDAASAYDQIVQLLAARLRDASGAVAGSGTYSAIKHARQIAGARPTQHPLPLHTVSTDNSSSNSGTNSGFNSSSASSVDATAGDSQLAQQIQQKCDSVSAMEVNEETTTVKQSGDSINDITDGTSNESVIKERVSATESQHGVSYNNDSTDTNSSKTMNIPDIDQVTTSIILYAVQLVRNICHNSFECSSLCSHRMSCILTTTMRFALFTDH